MAYSTSVGYTYSVLTTMHTGDMGTSLGLATIGANIFLKRFGSVCVCS